MRAHCVRCAAALIDTDRSHLSRSRAAAIALAALILYPAAVSLPMLRVQQLGHRTESSIIEGVIALLADGQLIVGLVILLCSIVFPLGKLAAILALALTGERLHHRHRALTYRLVEWTGRWGMLDVLLVAVLVAALKLGNVMEVAAGSGALAFAACVVLSLAATAMFDPRALWSETANQQP